MSDWSDKGLLGLPQGEIAAPGAWARIGRGMADWIEPTKQAWLNWYSPAQAAAYRKQRQLDEQIYERGVSGTGDPYYLRQLGQSVPAMATLPFLPAGLLSLTPETLASVALTGSAYTAAGKVGQRLGLMDAPAAAPAPEYLNPIDERIAQWAQGLPRPVPQPPLTQTIAADPGAAWRALQQWAAQYGWGGLPSQ